MSDVCPKFFVFVLFVCMFTVHIPGPEQEALLYYTAGTPTSSQPGHLQGSPTSGRQFAPKTFKENHTFLICNAEVMDHPCRKAEGCLRSSLM